MRVIDLFSGLGAFSRGLERAGMTTVGFVENDPFCQAVLRKHWPHVPIHDDVTTRKFKRGEADVICGGFPCQDVSNAGKRAGLSGERSGLYRELVRAIRVVRPRYAILENVAALLSDGMGRVLGDLAESGADAEWDCIPAEALGAPHERDRVFIVAHPDSERCGETGRFQHRQVKMPAGGTAPALSADASRIGRGQGRTGRPPDSFARVRDETRRNSADPYGARLAFREGLCRDAWEELTPAQRSALQDGGQSIWPNEPAISGVDDDASDWVERTRSTGNTLIWLAPNLIARSILASAQHPDEERLRDTAFPLGNSLPDTNKTLTQGDR